MRYSRICLLTIICSICITLITFVQAHREPDDIELFADKYSILSDDNPLFLRRHELILKDNINMETEANSQYYVSLRCNTKGEFRVICGGAIIAEKLVLTAAQCFWSDTKDLRTLAELQSLYFVAGNTNLRDYNYDALPHDAIWGTKSTTVGQWRRIRKFHVPRHFAWPHHDIAIAFIWEQWIFSENVKPIPLAKNAEFVLKDASSCFLTYFGGYSTLRTNKLIMMTTKSCRKLNHLMDFQFTDRLLCAKHGDAHDAEGIKDATDFGSPLVCYERKDQNAINSTGVLVGLASGVVGIRKEFFQKVSSYYNWIKDKSVR